MRVDFSIGSNNNPFTSDDCKGCDPFHRYVAFSFQKRLFRNDPMTMGFLLRILKHSNKRTSLWSFIEYHYFGEILHSQSIRPFLKSTKSGRRGIVLTTGNKYFRLAVHFIRTVRYLGCKLPIEIFFNGIADLSPERIRYFSRMHNVRVRNLARFIRQETIQLQTWEVKPYCMLASDFQEVIFADADALFAQNPEILFKDIGYIRTGALMFRDRQFSISYRANINATVASWLPHPHASRLTSNRFMTGQTSHFLESGVIVWDKSRHLYSLLAAALLNTGNFRSKFLDKVSHGDKEAFWIALEMLGEPYDLMPHQPANTGDLNNAYDRTGQTMCCGKMTHFDRDGRILWWNDSILQTKHSEVIDEPFGQFKYIANENGHWEPPLCISATLEPLPRDIISLIDEFKKLWIPDPLAQQDK
jgi:hypothetical protein